MLFEVNGLEVHYGKVQAVKGISLKLEAADIITLIGANGAGKSTTLRAISGLTRAIAGEIREAVDAGVRRSASRTNASTGSHLTESWRAASRMCPKAAASSRS